MRDITGDDLVFRPHALGYLVTLGVLLGPGAACLALAAHQHPAWLTGAALAAVLAVTLVSRYTAGAVIVRGPDLVFRRGTFGTWEVSLPIWEAQLEIRQGLLGRLLDTGVVAQLLAEQWEVQGGLR